MIYDEGAFYCANLISADALPYSASTTNGVRYLKRLHPYGGKKLLIRYDGEFFMFNKVKLEEHWLENIERLYVFSKDPVDL